MIRARLKNQARNEQANLRYDSWRGSEEGVKAYSNEVKRLMEKEGMDEP
jgi:hypothetical protein